MHDNRILVVEDDRDGREVLGRLLQQMERGFDAVEDGEQALEVLHGSAAYRAVIIDLALPGMDGYTLLRHIRDDPALAGLKCIAVTAYHTPELKRKAIRDGFDGYFAKPLKRARFMEELAALID